jgi:hypothetical protein
MPYVLDRTPTYRFSAKDLGPLARLQLRLAERVIAARPHTVPNTVPVSLGGRTVTLLGFGDLAIYFDLREPNVVTMYLVVDGKNLPDWFSQPTGTWFEQIDLTD